MEAPFICLTSRLVDKLPSDLIASVLAHECGHIACKHYLYHSMAGLLAEGICSSPLSKIPAVRRYLTPTIVRALLFWDRCSELSADRAAVLCDGGADKTVAVLLKLHGYKHVDREEFLKQAMDLRAFVNDSRSNRLMELMLTQDETHPRLATRAYECYEWSTSDRFKRILEGTYTPSSRHEFPIAADKATNQFGGGLQHHLRDFSHHPTSVGLLCSILTQFTGKVYGTDVDGAFQAVELNADGAALMGKNLHEKMLFGVVNWVFHMASDMAGSSGSVMKGSLGTGLPGPVVSLLKELSSTPLFRKMDDKGHREFSVWISKLFNGTLLGERDADGRLIPHKFDLRTELGIAYQGGRQALPVILNECMVRGFYFIRQLATELAGVDLEKPQDLAKLNWRKIMPLRNRTVERMLTVSSMTFTIADTADAAVHAAIESAGNWVLFSGRLVARFNYVGAGRPPNSYTSFRNSKRSRRKRCQTISQRTWKRL